MRIFAVIKGPSFEEVQEQIAKALTLADGLELRVDHFKDVDLEKVFPLCPLPTIIKGAIDSRADYVDLDLSEKQTSHGMKLIRSFHDFESVPEDLEGLYQMMQSQPADFYKMAVTISSTLEALKLVNLSKRAQGKLIAIGMGPYGEITRLLTPLTYAATLEDLKSAPGQLTLDELVHKYRYPSLNSETKIFGLIGDPVTYSVGDIFHNNYYKQHSINALYIKMKVVPSELEQWLEEAKKIPFAGLSVTMPLKRAIIPYLDELDPQAQAIGAVNTVRFHDNKMIGYNTDGIGALNAIGEVKDKHIAILGTGGSAKAVAYEAKRRGAHLSIFSRDPKKQSLHAGGSSYDILINCTPIPIPPSFILPGILIMDIRTGPKDTHLIQEAAKKGCTLIDSHEMFVAQAREQIRIWFKLSQRSNLYPLIG